MNNNTKDWYENSYSSEGIEAQRHWPNEELCRFMGRNYFGIPHFKGGVKILEVGCGSGANLKMLVEEGFDTYGIDLSDTAIEMVKQMWKDEASIHLAVGDMTALPYENGTMDAVVDVFSSYCLPEKQYAIFAKEVYRVLKAGGLFFSYTPSKGSDAWKIRKEENVLDGSTLSGMYDKNQPYYGNFYPIRFMESGDIEKYFDESRWKNQYTEKLIRTYNSMETKFEFLVFEIQKK